MGSAKKNLKATKKFEKTKLKGVLDKRKAGAKVKQRHQIADKKKLRKSKDAEFYKGGEEGAESGTAAAKPNGAGKKVRKVAEMSVDDFFQGGFEDIIKDKKQKSNAAGGKQDDEDVEQERRHRDDEQHDDADDPDGHHELDEQLSHAVLR